MSTGYKINNNDIKDLVIETTDKSTDPTSPFQGTNYLSSYDLTRLIGEFPVFDKGLISNYKQDDSDLNKFSKKGTRPRIVNNIWDYEIIGDSTRNYYIAARDENYLYILKADNIYNPGGSDYSELAKFSKSIFPYNVVPFVLFFELVGGGGGGANGGNIYGINESGGGGGSSGGTIYGWVPVRTISSLPITPVSQEDLIFSISRGGNGGSSANQWGASGLNSYFITNGSSYYAYGGGRGKSRKRTSDFGGGTSSASSSQYILYTKNGETGGRYNSSGSSLSINEEFMKEQFTRNFSGGSKGDTRNGNVRRAGGGAASTLAIGGAGGSRHGVNGSKGSGGGGGRCAHWVGTFTYTNSGTGGNGGNGVVKFYY